MNKQTKKLSYKATREVYGFWAQDFAVKHAE